MRVDWNSFWWIMCLPYDYVRRYRSLFYERWRWRAALFVWNVGMIHIARWRNCRRNKYILWMAVIKNQLNSWISSSGSVRYGWNGIMRSQSFFKYLDDCCPFFLIIYNTGKKSQYFSESFGTLAKYFRVQKTSWT